ncbi:hypothetical protein [Paenibacillus sp. FSL R7-0333]|uniref:hypothetical protein n=1 Tax=Paenibacillus sp. FSL R7-0333 TaxID=1926587 RepID=UPI0026C05540
MKVFFDGDFISFNGIDFFEVVHSSSESIEFQYKDYKGEIQWAHVWQVVEVKKAGD